MSVDARKKVEIWSEGTSYSAEEVELAYWDYVDECEYDGLEPLPFAQWAENVFGTSPSQPSPHRPR